MPGADGLKAEFEQMARDHRRIAELQASAAPWQGQDIVALKVTKNARQMRDGKRPAVLYIGAQHAREWITPEMVRRLAHHFLDGYGTDRDIRELVDDASCGSSRSPTRTATTTRSPRATGCGARTCATTTATAGHRRPTASTSTATSPTSGATTTRARRPTRQRDLPRPRARTRARDPGARRLHARGRLRVLRQLPLGRQLLLYGTGWQVATPTPDDVIAEAMAGDDAEPAVPGYDPDISAELYTTNGDTDYHCPRTTARSASRRRCRPARRRRTRCPDDEWEPEDCGSGFEFPDDEALVQAEFERTSRSRCPSPSRPTTRTTRCRSSAARPRTSASTPSTSPTATRRPWRWWPSARSSTCACEYRVDGGRRARRRVAEWSGGERYGDENDRYYAEFRGEVPAPARATRSRSGSARGGAPRRATAVQSEPSPTPSSRTPAPTCS